MSAACRHCGQAYSAEVGYEGGPVAAADGDGFCCPGCAAAYRLIGELGLDRYYRTRRLDPALRAPRPEPDEVAVDHAAYVRRGPQDGLATLHLLVEGLHCGACVWLIESVLARQPGVVAARLSMTTRRLALTWRDGAADANALVGAVERLGYRLVPYDPALLGAEDERRDKALLRALAVAGFAAANVMLLSVSVWAGGAEDMGPATRDFLHWVSALIALPAIAYAGRPFFASAVAALRAGRSNMDVPISLAVLLTPAMSLVETFRGGADAYFDSALALLFFLLIGRYLDSHARGRARSAASRLLALGAAAVTVIDAAGRRVSRLPAELRQGMTVLIPAGARLAVDGRVLDGRGDIDTGLISGESAPVAVGPGDAVFAGTLNLTAPLRVAVTAVGEDRVLAEIVRLMEAAEQGRARHVALADRVARLYAPVVHGLAAATFLGWVGLAGAAWQAALLNAVAVLIITCPCALALAIPAVQVVASGRLMRRGVLLKSATALERLRGVDTIVFDKTGTLTRGRLALAGEPETEALRAAAALAGASSHPLARALARAAPQAPAAAGVRETPGAGLALATAAGEVRLGSRRWCGVTEAASDAGPELWLTRPGYPPARFIFRDEPREDAAAVVADLRAGGHAIELLSGDRPAAVAALAARLGIARWQADCAPAGKCARLAALAAAGHRVLMVGDGLNDAPALAAAHVSMSPATAADISQTAADVVFQGDSLRPVLAALGVARAAHRLVGQNLALAMLYNLGAVPLAVFGYVTPLLAAVAMSSSSLLVIGNALRLNRMRAA